MDDNIEYNSWVFPSSKAISDEFEREVVNKNLWLHIDGLPTDVDEFVALVKESPVKIITPAEDNRIEYRSRTSNINQEIRAELLKEQQRASGNGGSRSFGASASYPFWDAPNNTTTVLRFLPDSDPNRIYFWRERQVIGIPFATVEGHPELTNVIVEVPCVKMYNKKKRMSYRTRHTQPMGYC